MDKFISCGCIGSILCLALLAGCNDRDERLAAFAEKSLDQQAQQNAAIAQSDHEVHAERAHLDQ
ncbi:MAG TPA: hypothetical protein VFE46_02730 [Pirellulales bacterium]|nr:hypothetical protein [Pirellulales bacterium]